MSIDNEIKKIVKAKALKRLLSEIRLIDSTLFHEELAEEFEEDEIIDMILNEFNDLKSKIYFTALDLI